MGSHTQIVHPASALQDQFTQLVHRASFFSQTQASTREQPKTMETPNGLEDWEVVRPSSGVEEMEISVEKTEATSVEEKTTHEQPSSSGKQEVWDGKIWSKYLSPNQ